MAIDEDHFKMGNKSRGSESGVGLGSLYIFLRLASQVAGGIRASKPRKSVEREMRPFRRRIDRISDGFGEVSSH